MDRLLKKHIVNLKAFEDRRKGWMVLSLFVTITVSYLIFDWKDIHQDNLVWVITSLGFLVAMIWWYWTMRLIRFIIQFRMEESEILHDIVLDIKDIKKEVIGVDKDK